MRSFVTASLVALTLQVTAAQAGLSGRLFDSILSREDLSDGGIVSAVDLFVRSQSNAADQSSVYERDESIDKRTFDSGCYKACTGNDKNAPKVTVTVTKHATATVTATKTHWKEHAPQKPATKKPQHSPPRENPNNNDDFVTHKTRKTHGHHNPQPTKGHSNDPSPCPDDQNNNPGATGRDTATVRPSPTKASLIAPSPTLVCPPGTFKVTRATALDKRLLGLDLGLGALLGGGSGGDQGNNGGISTAVNIKLCLLSFTGCQTTTKVPTVGGTETFCAIKAIKDTKPAKGCLRDVSRDGIILELDADAQLGGSSGGNSRGGGLGAGLKVGAGVNLGGNLGAGLKIGANLDLGLNGGLFRVLGLLG